MNEQNKSSQNHDGSPKKGLGEPVVKVSGWKRLLSKRWVYPAAYMAAAAIILTLVWVYQGTSNKALDQNPASVTDTVDQTKGTDQPTTSGDDAKEVIAEAENLTWPVAKSDEVKVTKPFYDSEGSAEDHQAAMVQYKDTFVPNVGIDLGREDGKPFEVKAAMSGKVTRVEEVPLMGYIVEITHANNLKTVYQSLSDVKVKKDAEVKQGDTLATAGQSEMEKDLGNHLHFEVYENGEPVNPEKLLPQK
ncbi:M23 family metallopeptidase [Paenibacillus sediminis]|uniref:Stage II sporulation protein Q n=1 Tax=Paenibacillus sediminis TaxID=664909 RepID=A0ABS4H2D2_9BACL|nr:M23 family metallopeptidase [Paenibacillus sediminis]MBP1936692.1 stage II sporulation protein Q [Paenibacillus sediminis]